jgi:hypothetical protein
MVVARMVTQLRDYRIEAGAMDDWVTEWRAKIVPIRRAVGFSIAGAWIVEEESRFVWLLRHPDGWEAFEAADAAYFASPERAALDPDPARFIESQSNTRLREVAV